jgi:phytoene dehydrogenase-like protein
VKRSEPVLADAVVIGAGIAGLTTGALLARRGYKVVVVELDDDAHRAFIDGQLLDAMQATADSCVLPNGALALELYRFGCHYMVGGLETIARDLAGYIARAGGEVHYATLAKAILQEGRAVRGVRTSRGEVHARAVISAVPLANAAALLENPGASSLPKRAAEQPQGWGAFTLYLGVDERCLPKDAHFYEQITSYGELHDGGNMLVSLSPAWDRSRAPKGKRAVTVSTHVDAAFWMSLERERYESEKRYMEDRMLGSIEQLWPKLRTGIEVFMSASPRTFHNFTRRFGGTVGGIPQIRGVANFAAPSHRSDLGGLFLAGDTVFPGQGTIAVSVSGYNAARSAARVLRRTAASQMLEVPKEATL